MADAAQAAMDRMKALYAQDVPVIDIAHELNLSYPFVYNRTALPAYGFDTPGDYREYLAKQRRFKSDHAYRKHMDRKRQRRPLNKRLKKILREALKKCSKKPCWFARQLNVSHSSVSLYMSGRSVPSEEVFQRICVVFDWSYETLDDILEED